MAVRKKPGPKKGTKYNNRFEPDWEDIKRLAHIQCTCGEIAAFLDCNVDTLNNRAKEKFDATIGEKVKEWAESGKCSLRRMQWKLAERSATMAIFLGKNMLGQSDKVELGDDMKKMIREFIMQQAQEYNEQINE
ncbi:MAG: hypothetical protein PVI43_00985 [Candidatus Bathyarchaeota archaeon]|jgi:hypothetical protein